jgi:amino acid permease
MPMSPGAQGRRTFFDRSFSKLEKGSVRGSTISLCSAAIGGGVLSLPYMFVLVGWGMGYVLLIVGAFASVWSNLIIAYLSEKYRLPNYD